MHRPFFLILLLFVTPPAGSLQPSSSIMRALQLSKQPGSASAAANAWRRVLCIHDDDATAPPSSTHVLPPDLRVLGLSLMADSLAKTGRERQALQAYDEVIATVGSGSGGDASSTLYATHMNRGFLLLRLAGDPPAQFSSASETAIPRPSTIATDAAVAAFSAAVKCCRPGSASGGASSVGAGKQRLLSL